MRWPWRRRCAPKAQDRGTPLANWALEAVSCAEVLRMRSTPQDGKHHQIDGAESTDELVRRESLRHHPCGGSDKHNHDHGAPRKGAPFVCINPGLVFCAVLRHTTFCSMFKASSQVSHKRIRMHDNARPGGDREYRSDLSLPLVDDLPPTVVASKRGRTTTSGAVRPRPHSVVEQSTRVSPCLIKSGS
jgi:hypothetical protein